MGYLVPRTSCRFCGETSWQNHPCRCGMMCNGFFCRNCKADEDSIHCTWGVDFVPKIENDMEFAYEVIDWEASPKEEEWPCPNAAVNYDRFDIDLDNLPVCSAHKLLKDAQDALVAEEQRIWRLRTEYGA